MCYFFQIGAPDYIPVQSKIKQLGHWGPHEQSVLFFLRPPLFDFGGDFERRAAPYPFARIVLNSTEWNQQREE